MVLLISSFWRAVLYCLHPKVILLSLLPLLFAMGTSGLLAYFFWQSAQEALLGMLDASVFVTTLAAWLAAVGLGPDFLYLGTGRYHLHGTDVDIAATGTSDSTGDLGLADLPRHGL